MRLLLPALLAVCLSRPAQAEDDPGLVLRRTARLLTQGLWLRPDMIAVAPDADVIFGADGEPVRVDFGLDIARRAARLQVGLGDHRRLALRVQTDARLAGAASMVRVRLDLALLSHRLTLSVPEVRVTPRFLGGTLVMEYYVPLVEQRF